MSSGIDRLKLCVNKSLELVRKQKGEVSINIDADTSDYVSGMMINILKSAYYMKAKENCDELKLSHICSAFREYKMFDIIANKYEKVEKSFLLSNWLAIDGITPVIEGNSLPFSKAELAAMTINPRITKQMIESKNMALKRKSTNTNNNTIIMIDDDFIKPSYTYIISDCMGDNELAREKMLNLISFHPAMFDIYPYIARYICEHSSPNIFKYNPCSLYYLMRMIHALISNKHLRYPNYLHKFMPIIISCVVIKDIGEESYFPFQWALRNYSANLIFEICQNFTTPRNLLQNRVLREYVKVFRSDTIPLTTLYGGIVGLCALRGHVVKLFVVPELYSIYKRIGNYMLDINDSKDKIVSCYINAVLEKHCYEEVQEVKKSLNLIKINK